MAFEITNLSVAPLGDENAIQMRDGAIILHLYRFPMTFDEQKPLSDAKSQIKQQAIKLLEAAIEKLKD